MLLYLSFSTTVVYEHQFDRTGYNSNSLRGEKLNYKSVTKEIAKPPFLAPEVQWASKFTVFA